MAAACKVDDRDIPDGLPGLDRSRSAVGKLWRRRVRRRRHSVHSSARDQPASRTRSGFTLIELLTVIAIIGVLGTLLLSGLSSARKLSQQTRSTANLRQIGLAIGMYLDDHKRRSRLLKPLFDARYLANTQVLICPADLTGNWGGLVNLSSAPIPEMNFAGGDAPDAEPQPDPEPTPGFSYLNPLPWEDWAWDQLAESGPSAGLSACQLHGFGKPSENPSIYDYEGLLLRVQRDNAVVKRKVFWGLAAADDEAAPPGFSGFPSVSIPGPAMYPWQLFTDELTP